MNGSGMFFGGGFMWITWVVIFVVIALVFKWGFITTDSNSTASESALEVLKKRYAKGEINEEEFNHKKLELEK